MPDEKPELKMITDQDQAMRLWIHQNMMCLTRGTLSCFASMPPEKVLLMVCLVTGQLMTELYAGDDIAVHKFRKACRDMFDNVTKQMPVTPLQREQPKAATADIGVKSA